MIKLTKQLNSNIELAPEAVPDSLEEKRFIEIFLSTNRVKDIHAAEDWFYNSKNTQDYKIKYKVAEVALRKNLGRFLNYKKEGGQLQFRTYMQICLENKFMMTDFGGRQLQ